MKALSKLIRSEIRENIIANLAGARYDQKDLTKLLEQLE